MAEHDGCKGCAYVSHGEYEIHCVKCAQNASDNYKRMTNADRIRSMSDTELSEFIEQISTDSMETISLERKNMKKYGNIKKLL